MDKNVNGSLLILGNGFDLNCGLKSSFSDYLQTKLPENIWYIILRFAFNQSDKPYQNPVFKPIKKRTILWMDVEDYIKRILYLHRDTTEEKKRLMHFFRCENYISVLELSYMERNNVMYMYNNIQFVELKNYFSRHFSINHIGLNLVSFLKQELVNFENDFKQYIKSISCDEEYKNNSGKILFDLIDNEEAYDVLTFNYTSPDADAVNLLAYGNINHIHGSVEDRIIIGFDSSDITTIEDNRTEMSKSFQKLFFKIENKPLPCKDQIVLLKFYGHSLGNQDYSYFHSIFDYYDIYNNGNVSLIFYYTPYYETDEENVRCRNDYIGRIYDLLNSYSLKATIHNEKSNIIISKLLLENRLFIKEIKKIVKK